MPAKPLVKIINWSETKTSFLKDLVVSFMEYDQSKRLKKFERYVSGKILDVGVGMGSMNKLLREKGYDITGIDVADSTLYKNYPPIIYNGSEIPFKKKVFDTGLLLYVLHHCSDPLKVLEETMRTCKRVVVIEDTYRNNFEKTLVTMRDSFGNMEFYQHPYRKVTEWQRLFRQKKWNVLYKKEWSDISYYGMYGRFVLFVIESK